MLVFTGESQRALGVLRAHSARRSIPSSALHPIQGHAPDMFKRYRRALAAIREGTLA